MPERSASALTFLLGTAAFVIIVAGMKAAASILVPFLMATFIAILSAPSYFWLNARGLPSALALLVVLLGLIVLGIGLGAMLGSSMSEFTSAIPHYQARLRELAAGALAWLGRLGVDTSDQYLRQLLDPGSIMRLASNVLSGLGNLLSKSFMILLIVAFMLIEATSLPRKLQLALKDPRHSLEGAAQIALNLKKYIAIKLWISMGTGLSVGVAMALLGVDFAVLWGMLAFLLNFVPTIGSIIAAVPPVLLSLVDGGLLVALGVSVVFLIVNIVFGNILEPRYAGRGVGLSALVVFLSLIFWGWVFGPMGMILAVPLTMIAKIVMDAREETRWLAILLGPDPHASEIARAGKTD